MTRKWLWTLGILTFSVPILSQHRWLESTGQSLSTDGVPTRIPLPNPGSGPTTLAPAPDGTVWFTQAGANRIGYLTFK